MPIYASTFGAVQTAYVGYVSYTLAPAEVLRLDWPTSYQDSSTTVAAYMDIAGGGALNEVQLPDATQVSVGQNFIIANKGSNNFDLLDFDGNDLVTIAPGQVYYYILRDNTTAPGLWNGIQFGVGTSSDNASALVGYGVNAEIIGASDGTRLNTEISSKTISTIPYNVQATDYTSLLIWTAGTGSLILPATANVPGPGGVPASYYVSINNASEGIVTVISSEVGMGIQGRTSLPILPNQTVTLVSIGDAISIGGVATKWFTLGLGVTQPLSFTYLEIDVGGGANVNLTPTQANNRVLEFTGELTSNITVFFPVITYQWDVYNNTTSAGGFNLSIQLIGSLGTLYPIPRGDRQIFYSNSISLFSIPYPNGAVLPGPGVIVTDGAGSPSAISYLADDGNSLSLGTGSSSSFTASANNVAIGPRALSANINSAQNTAIGKDALAANTTAQENTAVGTFALSDNNGNGNTAVGYSALKNNTSGIFNTVVGNNALGLNNIGSNNSIFGYNAGGLLAGSDNNVLIGENAGSSVTSLANSVFVGTITSTQSPGSSLTTLVGYGAKSTGGAPGKTNMTAIGANATVNASNSTAIGANAVANGSNVLVLGSGVNVGIGISSPSYGIHFGMPSSFYDPLIYFSNNTTFETPPGIAEDAIIGVLAGQPFCSSGNATYRGSLVTARHTGTAPTVGTATLVAGTATVTTAAVTADSRIFLTINGAQVGGADAGELRVNSRTPGVGFVIKSKAANSTSNIDWFIVNPV